MKVTYYAGSATNTMKPKNISYRIAPKKKGKIVYNKIFEEDTEPLKEIADEIVKI